MHTEYLWYRMYCPVCFSWRDLEEKPVRLATLTVSREASSYLFWFCSYQLIMSSHILNVAKTKSIQKLIFAGLQWQMTLQLTLGLA